MPRKSGIKEIDVSGGFVDDRGRRVNTDIPSEERGRVSSGKSNARKRLKQKQKEADAKNQEFLDEQEKNKLPKKKKKKKELDFSLDPEKEKVKKRKIKADKQKAKEKADTPKKKRKKKTVGELIKEGKPERARKKMERLQSKALAVLDSSEFEEVNETAQLMPPAASNSEVEFQQEYDHIYRTLGSIIRNLENKMTEKDALVNSKDVYALMTMYSQMRETIADIRSIKDMNEQAEELAQQVFDPAAKSAGESLVNVYYKITRLVRQSVEDPAQVEDILDKLKLEISDQAGKLQDQFELARGRIVDVMSGGR